MNQHTCKFTDKVTVCYCGKSLAQCEHEADLYDLGG